MTDDIVTQLVMFSLDDGTDALNKLLGEAANEIERLRKVEADRHRWAKWGEHVFTCPNKGINPCRECVSPATLDAMSRVDAGGEW